MLFFVLRNFVFDTGPRTATLTVLPESGRKRAARFRKSENGGRASPFSRRNINRFPMFKPCGSGRQMPM